MTGRTQVGLIGAGKIGRVGRIAVVMGLAAWQSYRENCPIALSEVD